MGYNFLVEIGGLIAGGFSEVSGLESEIEVQEYREGGVNGFVHQFPTQVTYPNLVLTQGLTNVDLLWNWYSATAQGIVTLLNGSVLLLDRQRLPVMWWNFRDAYPVKWIGPQFNASNTTEVAVTQLELVHRGITKPLASQLLGAVGGAGIIPGL
ncbi:phage tail protein [Myxacorys almedinensis A]|uniref:Phage tail protein n=2 Tax=Myxacorys TaxID=2056239 RepID=A0A8J7YXH6_9CYAN|nr:phage tail protein [Myxacorys almedinensis]NDJ16467.1 phage tail protein [Myxacorys almedinensis A]